jgi:hypothetical protein
LRRFYCAILKAHSAVRFVDEKGKLARRAFSMWRSSRSL